MIRFSNEILTKKKKAMSSKNVGLGSNAGLEGPMHTTTEVTNVLVDSPFSYPGWNTVTNFHKDRREDTAENTNVDFGGTYRFEFAKRREKLGPIQLHWTVPIPASAGSTFVRYVDYVGFHIIDTITFRQGSNQLYQITGRALHRIYHRLDKEPFLAQSHDQLLGGNLTDAQRNAAAAAAQEIWTPLDQLLWFVDTSKYLDVTAVSQKVTMEVRTFPLANVIQTDGAAPTNAVSLACTMKPTNIFVEDDERDQHIRRTLTPSGLIMQFEEIIAQEGNQMVGTAAQTVYNIRLDSFRGLIKELIFVVRDQANDVTTTALNRPNLFIQIASFRLLANSDIIVDTTTDLYGRQYLMSLYHSGDIAGGDFIYGVSWNLQPEDMLNSLGHLDFSGLSNPILEITFAAAFNGTTRIANVYGRRLNTLQLARARHG